MTQTWFRWSIAGLVLLTLVSPACSGDGEGRQDAGSGQTESGEVLAIAGEHVISRADLERRIEMMPEPARANLRQPEQQLDFLNRLVDERLLVQAAEDLRLDRDPEFETVMSEARRQLLAQFYYDHVLRAAALPDSADIQRYYDEHPDQFTVAERVGARQIVLATEAEARSVRQALISGAPFDSLLERSVDDLTRQLGGSLGVVSHGAPVRGLGRDDSFVDKLMALEVGAVSEPIETSLGYHVVQIESHDPERKRPLAAVRESLTRRVEMERLRSVSQAKLDSLRAVKGVTIHQEVLLGEDAFRERRAQELFSRAQETDDARERLAVYAQIADEFPESEHAAQAQFMRGFILIEELDDEEGGRRELERLLAEHPESVLVDSARWMLENIDSGAHGAEGTKDVGSVPPED